MPKIRGIMSQISASEGISDPDAALWVINHWEQATKPMLTSMSMIAAREVSKSKKCKNVQKFGIK